MAVVLSRAGQAQPAHLEAGGHGENLRSLLCTRKQESCLCSLETAQERAHCYTECAELWLVRGTLFGGAMVVFGLTLGKGLSSGLSWLCQSLNDSASLRHSLWSSFMFDI